MSDEEELEIEFVAFDQIPSKMVRAERRLASDNCAA